MSDKLQRCQSGLSKGEKADCRIVGLYGLYGLYTDRTDPLYPRYKCSLTIPLGPHLLYFGDTLGPQLLYFRGTSRSSSSIF
jgi:hypothetical protein